MWISLLDVSVSKFDNENFPTPVVLGVLWNLGIMMIIFLFFQVLSGLFLSFYLCLGVDSCLFSKLFIVKEISWGWGVSYSHVMVPSFLFFLMYVHILSGLMYSMGGHFLLWVSGIFMYVVFIMVSFTGYSLVYGSMSYWALVVAQNIVSFLVGSLGASCLLFDEEVIFNDSVLSKIFVYHYFFGLSLGVLVFAHVWALHKSGSSGGLFFDYVDSMGFSTMLSSKDIYLFLFVVFLFVLCLGFFPEWFFSGDNYLEVDVLQVPEEINPEWFLSLYFIVLSSFSSKVLGVICMFSVVFYLFLSFFWSGIFGGFIFSESFFLLVFFVLWFFTCFTLSFYGGDVFMVSGSLLLFVFISIDWVGLVLGYGDFEDSLVLWLECRVGTFLNGFCLVILVFFAFWLYV